MILEKQTEANILIEGDVQESIGMSLDLDSAQILMQMLSKNLYSDGIGSTIREAASNALDSHRKSGIIDPIIVSFKSNKDGNYEFSVQDFGVGLDANDVKNIISKYGKSTKRKSANELGMMGLGFKAGLAYTSSFYFICRKDGMERKYMMYEGEDVNSIDLLYESPTLERNGVKIIVPVEYGDQNEFYKKIQEQLAYFEHVYFNCGDRIKNDFTIIRHEHFQWSPLCNDRHLHLCLDNVFYPLDFTKLGISAIDFPIALRFGLSDGLFPVPNREQLKYTPEAKKAILDKLKLVANYFVEKYNESIEDTYDVHSIIRYYQYSSRQIKGFGSGSWDINPLKPFATMKMKSPNLNNVKLLDLSTLNTIKDYLFQEYKVNYNFSRRRFAGQKNKYNSTLYYSMLENYSIYVFSDSLLKKKQDWLRDELPNNKTSYLVRKEKTIPLRGKTMAFDSYYNILGLRKFPKDTWRERIKELQYIQSLLVSKFTNLDKMNIPDSWMEGRKKQKVAAIASGASKRRVKLEGEVTGKLATNLERYVSGKSCKFESTVFQLKDAHKSKMFTIYGDNSDITEVLFNKWFTILKRDKVNLIMFSERELKRLENIKLHNWMKIEDFDKGEHKVFKRAATSYLISQLYTKYPRVFDRMDILEQISTDLHEKLKKLDDYKETYFLNGNAELYTSILEVAQSKNLFDPVMYSIYKEVRNILEKLVFLNPILGTFNRYCTQDDGVVNALKDLFKYYRYRINWKHYKLQINEEMTKEEATEIEELEEEQLTK